MLLESEGMVTKLLHCLLVYNFHVFAGCLDHWRLLLEFRDFLWRHAFYVDVRLRCGLLPCHLDLALESGSDRCVVMPQVHLVHLPVVEFGQVSDRALEPVLLVIFDNALADVLLLCLEMVFDVLQVDLLLVDLVRGAKILFIFVT